MSETPLTPTDPETSEARRRAVDAGKAATALVKSQIAEIKERGPFFQARLGVVAAYVVIVLLTLALAPPGTPDWVVRQTRLSFGLSFKTALELTNNDAGDLEDVIVEVRGKGIEFDDKEKPGVWRTKPMMILEGLTTKLVAEQLYDDAGQSPPYSLVITSVRVLEGKDVVFESAVPPAGTQ